MACKLKLNFLKTKSQRSNSMCSIVRRKRSSALLGIKLGRKLGTQVRFQRIQ